MSDGITDAKRECKPIRYTSSRVNPAPSKCHNCIFITRNPHDNQWECTNPLQHGKCDEPNNCAFHITLDELAIYTRERLKSKLIGESKVICKFYVESESYGTCKNMNWHHNGTYRCNCEGDTSKCKFWRDNSMNKIPQCRYVSSTQDCGAKCITMLYTSEMHPTEDLICPFIDNWSVGKCVCRGYEPMQSRFEVHVLGKDNYIIGIYSSRKLAEQFIKDNIKVVEVIP